MNLTKSWLPVTIRSALFFLLVMPDFAVADTQFFPPDCFHRLQSAPKIEAAMVLANEASLYSQGPAASTRNSYRLTVTPAYRDKPELIVRLDVGPEAGGSLVNYHFRNSGKPVSSTSDIQAKQTREFEQAYLAADFTPVSYPKIDLVNGRQIVTLGIRGGNYWVFEALVNGVYRCVHRPAEEEGTFRDLVRSLLKIAGKDTENYR